MKTVLLLGDSVRQNYETVVKEALSDRARVLFTNDNNRFAAYTLRYVNEWIRALTNNQKDIIDIVHINCGLWDVIRLSNENTTFTSLNEYHSILKRIVFRIRYLCPKATILLAYTTSVVGEGMDPQYGVGIRRNSDIKHFNQEVKKVCCELSLPDPNDLYEVSLKIPDEFRSDLVHYDTEVGKRILGEAVAGYIDRFL